MFLKKLLGENDGGCLHYGFPSRIAFAQQLNLTILSTLTPHEYLRYHFYIDCSVLAILINLSHYAKERTNELQPGCPFRRCLSAKNWKGCYASVQEFSPER
jgi:hypothetical protein